MTGIDVTGIGVTGIDVADSKVAVGDSAGHSAAAVDLGGARIGLVGAGRIGAAMAQQLAAHGARLTVYARRPEVRAELSANGARTVDTIAGLGADNELVISCLYSDAQLDAIAPELAEVLAPGSVLASHTTGSPAMVQAVAERLAVRSVEVVDAPFSGTPDHIHAGTLTVLLGGADPAVARVERIVRTYAGTVIRTGDLGSALMLKLLNNLVFAANVQIGLDVWRLVEQAGVSIGSALSVLKHSSGGTTALNYMAAYPSSAAYADEAGRFMAKDLAVVEQVAAELGLDLGFLDTVARGGAMDVSAAGT
jgi:3-hydroxyisobutyrate dehydrogenase-like beta-hydroxyacid dehydrogenase